MPKPPHMSGFKTPHCPPTLYMSVEKNSLKSTRPDALRRREPSSVVAAGPATHCGKPTCRLHLHSPRDRGVEENAGPASNPLAMPCSAPMLFCPWYLCSPSHAMWCPSSPPRSASRARTSDTNWRPSSSGFSVAVTRADPGRTPSPSRSPVRRGRRTRCAAPR